MGVFVLELFRNFCFSEFCFVKKAVKLQGIMHPTDVGAAVPISYREFIPVEAQKPCDTMLLPIQIPCGVEGAIPRIWAVQRRLAGGIEGVVPTALRVSRFLCKSIRNEYKNEELEKFKGSNNAHVEGILR